MGEDGIDIENLQRWLAVIWLIAGGPLIVAALPVPALEPLRKLLWPVLRRGKLLRYNESAGKGFQRLTVPASFFWHFYVVGLFLNSILFFSALGFAFTCSRPLSLDGSFSSMATNLAGAAHAELFGGGSSSDFGKYGKEAWRLVFLLLIFEIHLTRRLYESIFVSSYDPSARINFFGYITALMYYAVVPLTLFLLSFQNEEFVRAFKGFLKQELRGRMAPFQETPDIWDIVYFLGRVGWLRYVGAAICLYGSIHQHACHEILASLRPDDQPTAGQNYGIPRGDWFELVSSAHYLAEIVIYAGLVIASGAFHPAMWIMFASVVGNLYLVAKPTHEWYLSKFDNYPKTRHPLFPRFGWRGAK